MRFNSPVTYSSMLRAHTLVRGPRLMPVFSAGKVYSAFLTDHDNCCTCLLLLLLLFTLTRIIKSVVTPKCFSFPCALFLSCLSLLFSSFFSFLSFFVFSLPCLFFPFQYTIFFSLFLFPNRLASAVPMRSDRYYVQYIRGSLSWVASGVVGFSMRE